MRQPTWAAVGCPPYPKEIQAALEDALAKGGKSIEAMVGGKKYVIELKPHFRQVQKADRTKIRNVERTMPPPTAWMRFRRQLKGCDPRWFCTGHLRRHGTLLIVGTAAPWMTASGMAMAWTSGQGDHNLLQDYVNSTTFWACFLQTVLATSGSKVAMCLKEKHITRRVIRWNLFSAAVALVATSLVVLEALGILTDKVHATRSFSLLSLIAVINLGLAALLHANLALHAWMIATNCVGRLSGSSERSPQLPLVAPMGYDTSGGGGAKGDRADKSAKRAATSTASAQPVLGNGEEMEDDGSREYLPADAMPLDDKQYIMFHGSTLLPSPAAAALNLLGSTWPRPRPTPS